MPANGTVRNVCAVWSCAVIVHRKGSALLDTVDAFVFRPMIGTACYSFMALMPLHTAKTEQYGSRPQ